MPHWQHETVATAAHLEQHPPTITPAQAQTWCNFIVWMPTELPVDCGLTSASIRKEAPPGRPGDPLASGRTPWSDANPAAFRHEIHGDGRRLRIKQFLYDWAFPALEHPCLWNSSTHAQPLDSGTPVWFGVDYLANPAASARIDRTLIELSVLEGEFTQSELFGIYRSMRAAAPEAVAAVEATPFSRLSYWARHTDASPIDVPIGLWRFDRSREETPNHWVDSPVTYAAEVGLPPTLAGYQIDDIARLTDDAVAGLEAIYVDPQRRGRELRLIRQPAGSGSAAPKPSSHPGQRGTATVAGTPVHLAWIDEQLGPFDAVWRDDESSQAVRLLSSTGVGMDRGWFISAMTDLVTTAEPAY